MCTLYVAYTSGHLASVSPASKVSKKHLEIVGCEFFVDV